MFAGKNMYKYLLFFVFPFLFCSCDSDDNLYSTGSSWVSADSRIIKIDTLSLDISTVMMDSVVTSGSSKILIGNIHDNLFGRVKSSSSFELTPESYSITSNQAVYDSAVMYLTYNDYYYGDTLTAFRFKVYPVKNRIRLNNSYLYNTSDFGHEAEAVASSEFMPRPETDSSYVKVNLSNTYGESIFNLLKNDAVGSQEYFLNFYKGLTIVPDDTNNTMLRFGIDNSYVVDAGNKKISTLVRLYYHTASENGTEVQKYTLDLNPSTTYQYNKIEHDFSGSALSGLSPGHPLSSSALGDKAYMMAGLGVYTRVQMPYVRNLGDTFTNYKILSAYLYLSPAAGYYTNSFYNPETLYYYQADKYNVIQSGYTDSSGNLLSASLSTGTEFQSDDGYSLSISDYINTALQGGEGNTYSILIYPSQANGAMINKLITGSAKNETNPAKSTVYVVAY